MPSDPVTILSPHLDDAVLSCWHVLSSNREVRVVNVFTGAPEDGAGGGWWDQLTGASDSTTRIAERLEEDRRALSLVGREPINLGLPEVEYRRNGTGPDAVRDALAEELRNGLVYAPAGVGRQHADHDLVQAAALALCGRERLRLYADLPHATDFGWPDWVTGAPREPHADVDALWAWVLRRKGLQLEALEPEVHALDDASFERKLGALRTYRTQAPALVRMRPADELRYEVVWRFREGAR